VQTYNYWYYFWQFFLPVTPSQPRSHTSESLGFVEQVFQRLDAITVANNQQLLKAHITSELVICERELDKVTHTHPFNGPFARTTREGQY